MAILVCLFRCMVMMCVFSAILKDDSKPMNYFNYAFYSATFAIILIAFSQINSIVSAALRTRYVNKYIEGLEPAIEKLNRRLYINHIINIAVDIANLAYFTVEVVRLYRYYKYHENEASILFSLNNQMGYYIGFSMLFCFLAIFAAYFFMRKTFIKSSNLQGSQYKDSL